MSKVRIYGDVSGYVDIAVPDNAGTTTLNLDKIPQADINGNIAMDTNTLYVDAANNRVGVGTASPNTTLDIVSPSNAEAIHIRGRSADDIGQLKFYENDGTTSLARLDSRTTHFEVGSYNELRFSAGGVGNSHAVIDTSGNFGIGIDAPTARLDVRRGDADGKIAEFHQNTGYGIDIGSSQSVAYISSGYNQRLDFKTDPTSGQTERMSILANGNVGIGTTNPSATLQITPPNEHQNSFRIYRGGSSGYELNYLNMSLYLGNTVFNTTSTDTSGKRYLFQINGTEKFRIDQNGEVGIGTTNPLRKLHISDAGDTHIMLQSTNALDNSEIFEIGAGANSANKVDLTFRTRLNSGSGGTEHMRITNDGYVTAPNQPVFSYLGNKTYAITATGTQVMSASNVWATNVVHALNRGSHFNASTGRFTAPVAGTYHFQFQCTYSSFGSGYLYFYMRINGTVKSTMQADQQTPQSAIVNHMYCELSANDYVDCAWTNNYISGNILRTGFSGMLVG